ncbi:hypothetical protein GCM10008949_46480 [Deinococcus humi]|nr:hypothetical protein GCM10008949_46480 [Deinococcus humi]
MSLALLRWDHRSNPTSPKFLAGYAIALPSIADKLLRAVLRPSHSSAFDPPSIKEWTKADHFVPLTPGEVESKRLALPLAFEVHLGTEPAPRTPQCFILLTTSCACSVMMCPDNR